MKIFFLTLVLTLVFSTGNAQWHQSSGPEGGDIRSIVSDGTNTFAATYGGGIFLSTNYGTTWQTVNNGLTELKVFSLLINGSNIYAGTDGGGVFLSSNNGTSWSAVNAGLTSFYINDLLINGTNLFAATINGGVFLSTNYGASWTSVNTGISSFNISKLATNGTNIFASSAGNVFTSSNNGTSWTLVNNGLTGQFIRTFAVIGTKVYVGTVGGGVFLSSNNGVNWVPKNSGLSSLDIDALATDGTELYVSVYYPNLGYQVYLSANFGNSWSSTSITLNGLDIPTICVSDTNIYAGTYGYGIYRSNNKGSTWAFSNNGLTASNIVSLALNSTKIFAGTYVSGVHTSGDKGNTWSFLNPAGYSFQTSLAASDSFIFVGSTGYAGLYRGIHNGTSWSKINSVNFYNIWSIMINDTNVLVGGSSGGNPGNGILFSNNGGTSFVAANSGLSCLAVSSLSQNDTILFAGTSCGVFKSIDNAATWTSAGLNGDIKTLACNGNILYAGTNTGVYRSFNTGVNWSLANAGITGFVKTICFSDTFVFAGTVAGVYYSSVQGNSWSAINTGLINTHINALVADSVNLYAGTGGDGTSGNGVWMRSLSDFGICIASIVSQTVTICSGQSVTVGSNTYTSSGIYSDTLLSQLGCDSIVTTNLTVNSFPTIPIISGDTIICSGQSETLSVSNPCSGCIYTWSNNLIGQSISVNTASNYFVSATNNCGTSSKSDSIIVSNNPSPSVTVNSDTICAGQSLMLTANGGTTYSWSFGASPIGVNTAMVSPTTTTTYSVIGTALGCSDTAYSIVTVNCTVGISDQKDDSFLINPNPSSGQFEINLPTGKAEITITNLLGQQIIKTFVAESTINLEVGTNGLYIIFIKTNQGVTRRKLIVSN